MVIEIIELHGVRITHQVRIFGQILSIFFYFRNMAKNWRNLA